MKLFHRREIFPKYKMKLKYKYQKDVLCFISVVVHFVLFFHFDNFIVDESLFILDIRKNDRLRRDFILMQVHDWLYGE